MSAPAIDAATFDALKETTGAEFVLELVDTFLQEAPVMLQELRGALAAKDADKFRRIAHSLKSNSNTFGALTLGANAYITKPIQAPQVIAKVKELLGLDG